MNAPAAAGRRLTKPFGHRLLGAFGLIVLGSLAYANSFAVPFIFDDIENICVNPAVRSFDLAGLFEGVANRRVLMFTFALNYAVGELDPRGYHLVNLGIHLAAALVLWQLLKGVLPTCLASVDRETCDKLAWFTAAVWLVHPLQTESVTYLVQRAESLMGLCFLLVLWLVMRGVNRPRPQLWYLAAIVVTWLGMGTKEVMATVLPVVLVMDYVLWSPSWRQMIACRGWLYLGMTLAIGSYFRPVTHVIAGGSTSAGFGCLARTAWEHLLSEPQAILLYLRLAIWPWPQCFDYCLPTVHQLSTAIVPGLFIVATIVLGFWGVYQRRSWAIPTLAFFFILAPTSSVVPIQDIAAEHRMYLPLAAVLAMAVVGGFMVCCRLAKASRLSETRRPALPTVAALTVLLLLTTSTLSRNRTYENECTLWTEVVRVRPQSVRAHNNLGAALIEEDQFDLAQVHLRRAWQLATPADRASIEYNLARSYLGQHQPRLARELLQRLVAAEPIQPELRYHLAMSHLMLGDSTAAISELQVALEQRPSWSRARQLLGEAYLAANRPQEAVECLSIVKILQPTSPSLEATFAKAIALMNDHSTEQVKRTEADDSLAMPVEIP